MFTVLYTVEADILDYARKFWTEFHKFVGRGAFGWISQRMSLWKATKGYRVDVELVHATPLIDKVIQKTSSQK